MDTHATSYRTYWAAWFVLLLLTVAMVSFTSKPLIIAGIAVKSSIIALWFMHLKTERWGLAVSVALAILGLTFVLFGLISIDAKGAW